MLNKAELSCGTQRQSCSCELKEPFVLSQRGRPRQKEVVSKAVVSTDDEVAHSFTFLAQVELRLIFQL